MQDWYTLALNYSKEGWVKWLTWVNYYWEEFSCQGVTSQSWKQNSCWWLCDFLKEVKDVWTYAGFSQLHRYHINFPGVSLVIHFFQYFSFLLLLLLLLLLLFLCPNTKKQQQTFGFYNLKLQKTKAGSTQQCFKNNRCSISSSECVYLPLQKHAK